MRYFIGYLLSGDTKLAHEELTDEIAERFGIDRLADYIPPHVTLKSPFDRESIADVEEILGKFAAAHKRASLEFRGFGEFDRRVIFADVVPSPGAAALAGGLIEALKSVPGLHFDRYDFEKKFHATVANGVERQFNPIWKFISKRKFDFAAELDNISILKKEQGR